MLREDSRRKRYVRGDLKDEQALVVRERNIYLRI